LKRTPVAPQLRAPSIARGTAEVPKPRRLEPLSADRYGVHFTADGEFCALLERVRGLVAHRLPRGDLMTLLKHGLEAYERELEKERFAVGRKTRPGRNIMATTDTLSAHGVARPDSTPEVSTADASKRARSTAEPTMSEPTMSEPTMSEPTMSDALELDRCTSDLSTPAVPNSELHASNCSPLDPPKRGRRASKISTHEASNRAHSRELFAPTLTESESQASLNFNPKCRRHVPADVVRAVFLRDGKRCSFVSPDGRRCRARRCLELDHIEPLAVGGEATIENLRLRCRAHNQWYARQYFGASRVNAAIQRSKRRRAAMKDEMGPGAKPCSTSHGSMFDGR
jgi:hypothetical protein